MTQVHALVDLDRRFFELGDSDEPGLLNPARLRSLAQPWSIVLDQQCAVILGEAGSGKTTEFELRHKALVAQGASSFAFTVEDLATLGVEGSLSSGARERFSSWKTSEGAAYFFIDSVDEARLHRQSLSTALRRLERELHPARMRAHVLISCRVSDWRAQADRSAIQSILYPDDARGSAASRGAVPPAASASSVRVFALAPLSETQVEALAATFGVGSPSAFTEAAKRAAAHAYLERPRDVEWLVGYWLRHGDVGSLTDLVENDVREKLIERNPEREPKLTSERARQIAEVLAGLMTLEQRATIRLPDGDMDPERVATSLDPARLLHDLGKDELRELLTLPLFDEATYGRVRIHHRSVTEYLASRWLLTLLGHDLADTELDALLFRAGPDGPVVPAELAPVAAWLAGSAERVRKRLLAVAPGVLLQGGDPNSLPDESRRELLVSLAQRYSGRDRLFQSFDSTMLRHLATGAIASTVRELLQRATQTELLETLLGLVEEGELADCAAETVRIAADASMPRHARTAAVRAAGRVASAAEADALMSMVIDNCVEIDHELGGALVEVFYPEQMSVDRLITLIERVEAPPPQTGTLLPYYLGHEVPAETAATAKVRLVNAVLNLVQIPGQPKSFRNTWLLDPLARMVVEYASSHRGNDLAEILPALRFYSEIGLAGRHDPESGADEIEKTLADRPDLKRLLFWDDVSRMQSKESVTRYFQLLGADTLWRLADEDREWLVQDARTRPTDTERLLAFDCLLQAPCREGAQPMRDEIVRRLIEADPAFGERFESYESPRPRPNDPAGGKRRKRQEAKARKLRAENLRWLHERIESIRDGTDHYALTQLAVRSQLDDEKPNAALGRIAEQFDRRVADATGSGWRHLWRSLKCPLPHEERRKFQYLMLAGQAGITLDVAEGLDFANLSSDEVRTAARFASRGMNDFPPWLDALATSHPTVVAEVLGECISADYAMTKDEDPPHAVLAKLSHATETVRAACLPEVMRLLGGPEPARLDVLRDCIEAVIATPAFHAQYQPIAVTRCPGDRAEPGRYALWWCGWLAVDASSALGELETAIRAAGPNADALVITVADAAWPLMERRVIEFPFPTNGAELGRFASIVFRHVRPDDDVRHIGVYSPGPRDHAESLRRNLLNLLISTPGEDTYHALKALANDPALKTWSDYFMSLAEKRLAEDVGKKDSDVAKKLVKAYEMYGLKAIERLEEAGLMTATVDVGILTIRDDEFEAVLAAFPDAQGILIGKSGRHHNVRFANSGKDKKYRIAIVRLIEQGNGEAQAGARDLIDDLRPKLILVVGIAGGVPGNDFTLGDVVVATRVNDYTVHKAEQGGEAEFDIGGGPLRVNITAGVANLRARPEMRAWFGALRTPLPDLSSVGTYGPDEWQQKVRDSLQYHFGAGAERAPAFHACPIGSSDGLIKDSDRLIQWLGTARKLGAVEMEAAGVYRATRERCAMLAIRGLSDIVGLAREERFTKFACETAAAFTRAYLTTTPV